MKAPTVFLFALTIVSRRKFPTKVNPQRYFVRFVKNKTKRNMAETITLQFLTLPDIKAQVRIMPDDNFEDNYLLMLGKAAERRLLKDIQRTYDEVVEMEGEWPMDLTMAALMLTASWYKNREPETNQSMAVVPYSAYEGFYMPYRKGTYSSVEEEG